MLKIAERLPLASQNENPLPRCFSRHQPDETRRLLAGFKIPGIRLRIRQCREFLQDFLVLRALFGKVDEGYAQRIGRRSRRIWMGAS